MPEDLSQGLDYPFLIGVYLAINAMPDSYLLVDGPECVFHKAEHIHGRHDIASTLLDYSGYHRVQYTGVDTETVATHYEGALAGMLRGMARWTFCRSIFLSAMPFCELAGMDYSRIVRESAKGTRKPMFHVPGRSLEGDWLEGYAAVLESLAASIDISGKRPRPGCVGVVGYFCDRTEGDHAGNLAELKRMLRRMGLDPVSIWLSNEPYRNLEKIKNASVIIALPHARNAGKILAKRLGVSLVEASLPFGLEPTCRWLRQIGRACGNRSSAEAFVESELRALAPKLEWAIPRFFLHKKSVWIGDPYLFESFRLFAEELGIQVSGAFFTGAPFDGPRGALGRVPQPGVFRDMKRDGFLRSYGRLEKAGVDLVIGNAVLLSLIGEGVAKVEFGFPSYTRHVLSEEPYLGFRGVLCFSQRMANATKGV